MVDGSDKRPGEGDGGGLHGLQGIIQLEFVSGSKIKKLIHIKLKA